MVASLLYITYITILLYSFSPLSLHAMDHPKGFAPTERSAPRGTGVFSTVDPKSAGLHACFFTKNLFPVSKEASRLEAIATRNKKLLGAPGLTRDKKLLVTRALLKKIPKRSRRSRSLPTAGRCSTMPRRTSRWGDVWGTETMKGDREDDKSVLFHGIPVGLWRFVYDFFIGSGQCI